MSDQKKKIRFPSAIVILIIVIIIATILTYIIPAGEFTQVKDEATGIVTTSLEDFHFIDSNPVKFWAIPVIIVKAFAEGSTASIVLTYLFMGGAIYILTQSGAFQALFGLAMNKLKGRRVIMVAGFTSMIAVCNLVLSPHAFVAFVPFSIQFARAMGYDALVGVAMPLLGGAVAFSTGAFLATTMIAQTIVGLPIFSGALYRLFCLLVLLVPTILYIYHYGEQVRTGKKESIVAALEKEGRVDFDAFQQQLKARHIIIILIFIAAMLAVIIGSSKYGWDNVELSAMFMVMGVVVGLVSGDDLNTVTRMYITGSSSMMFPAAIAGLAGAATGILTSGNIMYTIVYFAAKALLKAPKILYAPVMFLLHLLVNCIIVSGGGQAAATMPIMAPIARICGLPMQSAVLTYNLGDGLGNYVLPYSSQLVTYINAGGIAYDKWMKFVGKLFGIWVVCACVLTAFSTLIWR